MSEKLFKSSSTQQIKRLMSFMKKRIWLYLLCMVGLAFVFAVFLSLVTAYKSRTLFDAAASGNMPLVKVTAIEMIISILVACVLCPICSYGIFYCIQKTIAEVRLYIFKQIEELPMSYFDKNHSGEIMSCLNNDLNALEDAYFWPILLTILSIILGIGSAGIMFYLNPVLAIFTIFMGIITSLVNSRFAGPIRVVSNAMQQHLGFITGRLVDLLSGFYVIKMFCAGSMLSKRFNNKNEELADATVKYAVINSALEGSNYLLGNIAFLGVIIIGAVLIANHRISVGTAIACSQLFGGISFMFGQLGGFVSQMQRSLAGASRVFQLLDESVEPESYSLTGGSTGDMINFQKVSFSYDAEKRILDGIEFSIQRGKIAALVGPSGSGKSSIVKLLMGFYPADTGSIAVNGKPIQDYTLEQLRNLIAYVPQDAYLFHGTVKDNIAMGKENASKEEIISAAKAANAHDFIMELPQGYDTVVGERGARLSGGQRQRIAIARAIIKNAPILILDEATSALDSESEQLVQQALNNLMKNRTVIIIAHRLSTIENADLIYVLEDGKIVEKGTHRELIEAEGIYNSLYELQFS
ncbi:MAG: ABC transporter ATP-binding protein/permease [Clostridia bacterium]|nr:ABC transporter ATP-binding protein/permease [Clostridia bacterium]